MFVRRGIHSSYESREEELSEIEVSEDVGSELHVVAVSRDLVHWAPHHSRGIEEDVEPTFGSAGNPKNTIVSEARRRKRRWRRSGSGPEAPTYFKNSSTADLIVRRLLRSIARTLRSSSVFPVIHFSSSAAVLALSGDRQPMYTLALC